jgi:hypothetical protein
VGSGVFGGFFFHQPERMSGDFDILGDQDEVVAAGGVDSNAQVAKRKSMRHEGIFMLYRRVGPNGPVNLTLGIFETQLETVFTVELGEMGVYSELDRAWKFRQAKCASRREQEVVTRMVILEDLATDHKCLDIGLWRGVFFHS